MYYEKEPPKKSFLRCQVSILPSILPWLGTTQTPTNKEIIKHMGVSENRGP